MAYPTQRFRKKPCKRCGKAFQPRQANHAYCGEVCRRGTYECVGCDRSFVKAKKAKGLYCSKVCFYNHIVPIGTVRPNYGGYTITKVPPGTPGAKITYRDGGRNWMWTHRYVMQKKLGRALLEHESVHHKNGARSDNRPSNLELWSKSQPSGQRALDKVVWALELIALYPDIARRARKWKR